MTTHKTAASTHVPGETSLHKLSDAILEDAYVSSRSCWTDAVWIFDKTTPGGKNAGSRIAWDVELPDGRSLLDPIYADLLNWLKRFCWSLFVAPGDNASALKVSSAPALSSGLRYFAIWMVDTGRAWPSELDADALVEYCDDLRSLRLMGECEEEPESEATLTAVTNRLSIPVRLWQQRTALQDAGIKPLPYRPFEGRGANAVAKEITSDRGGWIQPLPDEVALLIMNAAWDFLDTPARDILALQQACHAADNPSKPDHWLGPGTSKPAREARRRRTAAAFEFSCRRQESVPWHPSLPMPFGLDPAHGGVALSDDGVPKVMQQARHLVLDLANACTLVIQATTGMRMSEICGLPAGTDPETGMPSCVRLEDSETGLNELFIVRTRLTKTEATPRSEDWVLGMQPKDRDREAESPPPAVRAILILDELLAPYRTLLNTSDLLVSFSTARGLPTTSSGVRTIENRNVLSGMRNFIERRIDWSLIPDESSQQFEANDLVQYKNTRGRIIRSHQWRKLFANFAIRVDPGLLPALQMHFQHVSLAMTENGYVGSDPALLLTVLEVLSCRGSLHDDH